MNFFFRYHKMGIEQQLITKLLSSPESNESLTPEFLHDLVERFADEGLEEVRRNNDHGTLGDIEIHV
jgi:hypothetical protein